jgi:hypothetical protein
MAEVTAMRSNALPYPVYGAPWTVVFPMLDADGDLVTGATTPDSEVSKNGDTFADCTNEATEIATSSGIYYLTLTATEMTADIVAVIAKSATSGMKTTPIVLYPRKLVELASGTAQGGAAGYITLAAGSVLYDNQYSGCVCVATLDTTVEARILGACTASNQQCVVTPEWNTTPDSDDTYKIYLPEGMRIPTVNVVAISDDTSAPPNLELMFDGTGYAGGTTKLDVNTASISANAITATSINADAIEAAKIKDDAITAAKIAAGAIDNATFAADVGSTAYASNIIALAVRKVLDEIKLDHLVAVADSDDVADNSIIGKLASTDGDWSKFSDTTDSLQSIRDKLPTNLEDMSITDTTGLVALQAAQKVDVDTIKTQAVTCGAGVTVGAYVGQGTAAIAVDASGNAAADIKEINGTAVTGDGGATPWGPA